MFRSFMTASRRGPRREAQGPSNANEAKAPAGAGLSAKSINTAALTWGMHRLFAGRAPDLRAVATRSWELHPAEVQACPPAIYLPGAPDRISALSPWRDWDKERQFIDGGQIEHAATQAHLVERVNIADAFVYRGPAKMQAGFGTQRLVRNYSTRTEHLSEAHLVSNWAGSHYFGMFLRAVLPLELLPEDGAPTISVKTKPYIHEEGYRDILSMPCPHLVTNAQVDRLIFYTDFGQNASKAVRYAKLRQRLRQTLGPTATRRPGVYLKRGATGEERIISNEVQLEAEMVSLGFDIVEPAKMSAREIAPRLLDVPVVVTVEGSHMAHAIYTLADGGTLLAIQPPDRFALAFKELTDRAGLRFAFTVGHPAPGGFYVDIDDLKRTLDLVS